MIEVLVFIGGLLTGIVIGLLLRGGTFELEIGGGPDKDSS